MKAIVLLVLTLAVVSAIRMDRMMHKRQQGRLQDNEGTGGEKEDILKPRQVIVTMSYMDEEAASVLKGVLKIRDKFSAVHVIERAISPSGHTMLWERPIKSYPGDLKVFVHEWVPKDGAWAKTKQVPEGSTVFQDDPVLNSLKAGLTKTINDNKELPDQLTKDHLFLGSAKMKTCDKVVEENGNKVCAKWNSVVRLYSFGQSEYKGNTKPIIIVIRTPEMGMDMDNFMDYNRLIMKAIRKTVDDKEIQFYAIGASGAANAEDCVGHMRNFKGSLFVGDVPNKNKPTPLIAYDNVADKEKKFVNQNAHQYMKSSQVTFENMKNKDFKDSLTAVAKVKDSIVETLDEKDKKRESTAMTASYFMGLATKKAADDIKIHSSNTEDYWMIKLIHEMGSKEEEGNYPKINVVGVYRVDADPYPSDDDAAAFIKHESAWVKANKCVDTSTYVEILLWSKGGMKPENAPDVMCWDAADLYKYLAKAKDKKKDTPCYLNPFFVEGATDMVKDAIKDMPGFDEKYCKSDLVGGEWKKEKETDKNKKCMKDGSAVDLVNSFDVASMTKEIATKFVDLVAEKLVDLSGHKCEKGKMNLFVRSGWQGYDKDEQHKVFNKWPWTGAILDEENKGKGNDKGVDKGLFYFIPDGTGADRLLYKANNFVVMDQMCAKLFSDATSLKAYATGDSKFPTCEEMKK